MIGIAAAREAEIGGMSKALQPLDAIRQEIHPLRSHLEIAAGARASAPAGFARPARMRRRNRRRSLACAFRRGYFRPKPRMAQGMLYQKAV